jgi:hypothetical protein
MSDYKIPDLPSDDDLGITDEDREFLKKELGEDSPEISDAELRALLGDEPAGALPADPETASDVSDAKAAKKARKAAKKAEKEARKAAKRARREEKERSRERVKQVAGEPSPPETDAERVARVARAAAEASQRAGDSDTGASPPEPPKDRAPAPPSPEGPRRKWRGPVTLAFLLVLSVVASSRTGLPGPVAANAPDTAFSSSRAMSMLAEIARDAHPPGSPEHERVRGYLLERLAAMGLDPDVQTATSLIRGGTRATVAKVRNIVARIPGSDPTGAVLMTAHYDGRGIAVGAGDDGSGVVTILEAVRAILAGDALRNDLIILITDGEELPGLLGAKAFIDQHPWMADVSLVLGFEMRGSSGPSIMFETKDRNGWVIRALAALEPTPLANSMSHPVYERMREELATDYTLFKEAGVQGLNFAAIGNGHVYHQVYDTPDNVSERTLQDHGTHALGAARYFGDANLSVVDEANVVYFALPLFGLVLYPASLVLPISGALVLLLVVTFFLLRREGSRPGRVAAGAGVALLAAVAAGGGAYALLRWIPRFHPEAGSLHGSLYHHEGWYILSLAGLAFTVVTAMYAVARRWLGTAELALGASVLPLGAAIALSIVAPLGAMDLQWPVAAALISAALAGLLGPRSDGTVGWLTALLLTVPVLVLLVPVTELLWIAMSIEIGAALTVVMVMVLHLCAPALEAFRHPNSWWAPATGLVVSAVALGLGIFMSTPSAERPAPSTLVYAYEHGTGAALWATDPDADSLDGDARAWAVERAGGTFDGIRDLQAFGYLSGPVPTKSAPVVSAPPPEVTLVRDTVDESGRRVTLEVRSRIGAELMAFARDDRVDLELLAIDGASLEAPQRLERVDYWGEPDSAVVLELEMPADAPIGLHVIEHLLRPEELLGVDAFARPPGLAPDITRMSDRAMFRYSVGAFVDPRHALVLPGTEPEGSAAPSSQQTSPDTASSGAPPDSSMAQPDSGSAGPDSAVAQPDTAADADSSVAQPDTGSAAPQDTAVAVPDTGAVGARQLARTRPGGTP